MPVSHDRKVKVEASKFGSQKNCSKLMPKKAGLLVDTMAIGSPAWSCQTVHYRQGWRVVRGQKTNGNSSEAVQL